MSSSCTKEEQLLLAEYEPLRDEVNRTVDRMNANEVTAMVSIAALVAFQISIEPREAVPPLVYDLAICFVVLSIAFFGESRARIFERHMRLVAGYLGSLEKQFSATWGWTTHYKNHGTPPNRRIGGQRKILWRILQAIAFFNVLHLFPHFI